MLPADQKKFPPRPAEGGPEHLTPLPPGFSPEADQGQAPPPASLSAAPSLGTLLHALRKSWKVAVPVALAGGAAAAALIWALLPTQYTSSSLFRIQSRPAQSSLEDEGNFAAVQKSQVGLLKSHDVLAEAIQKSRVAELYGVRTTPAELQKKLTVNFIESPEMLTLSLSGPHPEAVAALLDTLGEVFPARTNRAEEERIKLQIAQLQRRLAVGPDRAGPGRVPTLAEQLRDKREELRQAEKAAGLDDANDLRGKAAADRILQADLQRGVNVKRAEIAGRKGELDSKRDRLRRLTAPAVSDGEVKEALRNDLDYKEVVADITKVRKEIDRIKESTLPVKWAELLATPRKQLAQLNGAYKDLVETTRAEIASRAEKTARETLQKEIADLEDRLELMKQEDELLKKDLVKITAKVEEQDAGGPRAPVKILTLRDQVEQLTKEVNRVGEQLAALNGSLPVQPRVVCLNPAFVPTERDLSRPLKFSVGGGLGVFALLLGGVCLLEARGRRVYAAHEIVNHLGLSVVGTLPRLPGGARGRTAAAGAYAQADMVEAIDALRTVLLHSPRIDGARVVLIASAREGEGKSTLASHLAASLARAWRKTLLIDGDLRNPNQHKQFDQPLEPGLCEALRGEVEFDDAIKPTPISRLWLLPAGRIDAHALQALAQDGVSTLFDWLKEQYDFIVIDSSPVLPVADALLLGKQADAVLLSVMKDVSRIPAVYQAQQRFESLHIRVIGTVVIGEKTERYGHPVAYGPTVPG